LQASELSSWPHHELSRFVEAGNVRWHVQRSGSGPLLLLVHGTAASTHSWRDLIPILARDYSVLAVDLPGHGFSSAAHPAGSSIAGMSEQLSELLRTLDVDPDYCVGHSAGAVILCRLALDGHIAPRRIVGINGAFLPPHGTSRLVFSPIAQLLACSSALPRLIARCGGNTGSVTRIIESTGSRLDSAGIDLYVRLVRDPAHVAGALAMLSRWNLRAFEKDLPRLATPLMLMVGERDRAVPPAQAFLVQERVMQAEVCRLPGGHLAHEEDPRGVAQELARICRLRSKHIAT
jgi:magnesium chelatase accessory protein